MELTAQEIDRALVAPAEVVDQGTNLSRFDARVLAHVLELETAKARANGLGHVRLTLDLTDTAALAAHLRRSA
jgi:hypothetical protein